MRAAAIQFFATPFDLNRNLQTAERLIYQATLQGAQVAVLPELCAAMNRPYLTDVWQSVTIAPA